MCTQVYKLLDAKFSTCPWPVPPSSIFLHLPIKEIPGEKNAEDVLKQMIRCGRKWRRISNWKPDKGPRPAFTYFDDGSPTSERARSKDRYYMKNNSISSQSSISLVEWGRFLSLWSVNDLDAASRILRVSSVHDLSDDETDLLRTLRTQYSHLLFLDPTAPLHKYQRVLRDMHNYGILNLHLTPVARGDRAKWEVSLCACACTCDMLN